MKIFYIFSALLFFSTVSFAQILNVMESEMVKEETTETKAETDNTLDNSDEIANFMRQGNITNGLSAGGAFYVGRKSQGTDIDGDVYLDSEIHRIILLTKSGEIIKTKGRYRVYDDQMEIHGKDGNLDVHKDMVQAVAVDDAVFVPRKLTDKKGKTDTYWFQILSEGAMNLYKKYNMEIRRADYNPALGSGNKNDYLFLDHKMYYEKGDADKLKPEVLKVGRASVLEALKRKKNAVNTYAKNNRIKWSKEEDLVKLFDFYNQKSKE